MLRPQMAEKYNLLEPKPYHQPNLITYNSTHMHLIYSALRPQQDSDHQTHESQLRYRAYLAACAKHRDHIAKIQKHFPNWVPRFR